MDSHLTGIFRIHFVKTLNFWAHTHTHTPSSNRLLKNVLWISEAYFLSSPHVASQLKTENIKNYSKVGGKVVIPFQVAKWGEKNITLSEDYDHSTFVCKSLIIHSTMDSENIPQGRHYFGESQNPVVFRKPLSINFSLLNNNGIIVYQTVCYSMFLHFNISTWNSTKSYSETIWKSKFICLFPFHINLWMKASGSLAPQLTVQKVSLLPSYTIFII